MLTKSGGAGVRWLGWSQVLQDVRNDDASALLGLADQLEQAAFGAANVADFLRQALGDIAGEFGANGVCVYQRTPEWKTLGVHGRWTPGEGPFEVMTEALDRESAVYAATAGPLASPVLVAPVRSRSFQNPLLVLTGRNLADDILGPLWLAARALGTGLEFVQGKSQSVRRIDQLRSTLRIASSLSQIQETEPLLNQIAQEATRLLECDRASIFIWDKEHGEVVARPALGVEGGSLRLPDKTGVVGEVIHSGRLIRVDDAYHDGRFSQAVDATSGYRTKNLICCPLNDHDGKRLGAFEVINKSEGTFSDEDEATVTELAAQVAVALQNTRERETLLRSHRQLTEQVTRGVTIIGESPAINAMRGTIRRLATTDLPVLILGESGTGKEVVAQSLHYLGTRAERPFIAVNCAALAESLLESELFGHEKGAFTDARELRRGKFELAEGGTIFLDEIGDMSQGGQAKLLRVLEQKVITRVGGSQPIPINARVIAATNANLAEMVKAKKFREDLYFRLNVVTLDLPALRNRPEDITPLAEYFLNIFATQARRPRLQLSAEARKRLQAHPWPGNVRELRNLMERVAFLAPGDRIESEDLAFILSPERDTMPEPSPDLGLSEATNRFQQEFIRRAIKRVRGNMSEAARLMGLHRSNLYRKMRQLAMSEAGEGDLGDDEV